MNVSSLSQWLCVDRDPLSARRALPRSTYRDRKLSAHGLSTQSAWVREDWILWIGERIFRFGRKLVLQLPASTNSQETYPVQAPPADKTLRDMRSWAANWNGRHYEAPLAQAIENARMHVSVFRNVAKISTLQWCEPHVTASPDGEPVFEWWCGEKKLTIYFQDRSAAYVKVWGANVHSEMEDGELGDFFPLLTWLTT